MLVVVVELPMFRELGAEAHVAAVVVAELPMLVVVEAVLHSLERVDVLPKVDRLAELQRHAVCRACPRVVEGFVLVERRRDVLAGAERR